MRILKILESLLRDFAETLEATVSSTRKSRHLRFIFRGHDALYKLTQGLEAWERSFNNAVFSLVLTGGRQGPPMLAMQSEKRPDSANQLNRLSDMIKCCLVNPADSKPLLLSAQISEQNCRQVDFSQVHFHPNSPTFIM